MPLVYHKKEKELVLGIWHSTESRDELLSACHFRPDEKKTLDSFLSDQRKREWLTTRVLLQLIEPSGDPGKITYDRNGKPHLDNGSSISISHTKDFVAVLRSSLPYAGLDLETIHNRILRISKKFLGDTESDMLPSKNLVEHLHVIWGAKEVLYKIHGTGEIDFKKHLVTEQFEYSENGFVRASIRKDPVSREYLIHYENLMGMMLAYAVSS